MYKPYFLSSIQKLAVCCLHGVAKGSFVRFLSVLGGKTAESVVKVVNFRGLALARLSIFTGLDCGGVSVIFFSDLLFDSDYAQKL